MDEEEILRERILEMLKRRRLNYPEIANVSDETLEALSCWIMDVINGIDDR